ncbi:MAG: hypothetical protein IJI10_07920 [Eubacterium sp.]|nr:hypothetical protein [Eubacterium sp.]
MENQTVLCAANHYIQQYYFNEEFAILPQQVQDELQIMCVLFTEEVGGILIVAYDENGTLCLQTEADPDDVMYDEIGAGLKIKAMQEEKKELFESLELFYQMFG